MVTVLITTYNDSKYIQKAIKSVLGQSYKEIELLIIDDGSTDSTLDFISRFVDTRIHYKRIEHLGRAEALNIGLKESYFDWVMLMDSDDIIIESKIETLSKHVKYPNQIISSWSYHYCGNKLLYPIKFPTEKSKIKKSLALHGFDNSVLMNKSFILEKGGYNNKLPLAEDYELWLRILDDAEFLILPKYLNLKQKREESLSGIDTQRNRNMIYNIQKKYYENDLNYFGIFDKDEENLIRGFREYFYGTPKIAKKYWNEINFWYLRKPNLIIAVFFISLPMKLLLKLIDFRGRQRIDYLFKYFSIENKFMRKKFKKLLKA